MSDLKLIVPIAAQALVVYEAEKAEKLKLGSRFTENSILGKDFQYDVSDLLDNKDEKEEDDYFKPGVHLHWRLPKLLKHGITNDKGENLQFPAVPNRWIVVRYQTNNLEKIKDVKKISAKVWVIKSDFVNDEAKDSSNWVVLESVYKNDSNAQDGTMIEEQKFVFKAIGKTVSLHQSYFETEEDAIDLTAVGATNPFFSSIYDESKDVFGFHDDMEGAKENDVFSYVIKGWYSNSENDPLDPNTKIDKILVAKICQNWLNEITPEKPIQSLFCHQLYGVKWNNSYPSSGVPKGDVNVSIGQNPTEALAAYLKKVNTKDLPANIKKEEIEAYLNGMFNYLFEDEREGTSIEKIRVANHKKQFSPKSRGILWEVKKIESNQSIEEKDKEKHFFPADKTLVEKLKKLNKQQVAFNKNIAELKSLQQEYYFNWYKKVLTHSTTTSDFDDSLHDKGDGIKKSIEERNKEIKVSEKQIKEFVVEINQKHHIKVREDDTPNKYEYELVKVNEDLFWQPSDPAVLFYGQGLGNVNEFYQDVNDKVACRLSSQIINQLLVNRIDYSSESIFGIDPNIANAITHDVDLRKLVSEAFLLDPTLAAFTAIKAHGDLELKIDSKIIENYVKNNVKPAQNDAKIGVASFACKTHTQAWEPLFMLWEVGFRLNDSGEEIKCYGLSPMTGGINKTLSEIAPKSKYDQILSQNLSGFHKFLLGQYPCLQLPPLKYGIDVDGDFDASLIMDSEMLEILGHQSEVYVLAPNPNQSVFSPILDGKLTIKKLSLVDGFGQQRIVMSDNTFPKNISISEGLSEGVQDISKPIEMPKRIIQPTRLHFDWLNANEEVLYQDTGKIDHPIMGWLVPNFLDKMVMIYDHQGHEVKSIRYINDNKVELYYPSKDGVLNEEKLKHEREAALDPDFKMIIEKLNIKQFLKDCKELKKGLPKTNAPLSSSAVAMLYGTPIAVAKGQFRLEILGEPIKNPKWKPDTDTGNIDDLNIHLKMGKAATYKDDGLLGYFIGEKYYNTYSSTPELPIKVNSEQKITVLLDAGSGFYVSAEGGMLPTQCIKLFPHAVEELSKEISISLMLSPFLSDKSQSYIPTPNTPDAQWNWIHKTSVNIWKNPSTVKKNSQQESFDFSGQQLYEGWIKMNIIKPKES